MSLDCSGARLCGPPLYGFVVYPGSCVLQHHLEAACSEQADVTRAIVIASEVDDATLIAVAVIRDLTQEYNLAQF